MYQKQIRIIDDPMTQIMWTGSQAISNSLEDMYPGAPGKWMYDALGVSWDENESPQDQPALGTLCNSLLQVFLERYANAVWIMPDTDPDGPQYTDPLSGKSCTIKYLTDNKRILLAMFRKYMPEADKLAETMAYEYDPIENYNRIEHWTDERTDDLLSTRDGYTEADETKKPTVTSTRTPNGWSTEQVHDPSPISQTQTTSNSGFANSSALQPTESVTTSYSKAAGTTGEKTTSTQSGTLTDETVTQGKTNDHGTVADTGTQTTEHDGDIHGNIGTVTTQDMIKQEREIYVNVLDWFVDKLGNAVDWRTVLPFYGG